MELKSQRKIETSLNMRGKWISLLIVLKKNPQNFIDFLFESNWLLITQVPVTRFLEYFFIASNFLTKETPYTSAKESYNKIF